MIEILGTVGPVTLVTIAFIGLLGWCLEAARRIVADREARKAVAYAKAIVDTYTLLAKGLPVTAPPAEPTPDVTVER